jgi:SNF2 family DNA or RNA helicase
MDPAVEVQAAGRIHRLGQTKDVLIKRMAFRNSVDETVCQLHDKIRAGTSEVRDGFFSCQQITALAKK